MRILSERHEEIRREERRILAELQDNLLLFGADPQDTRALQDTIAQLDELFLIVVVGEFNSGKSAVINALLGQRLLPEGVTPTTTQINLLRYGPQEERRLLNEHQQVLSLTVDWLRDISIVDTPGTNAIIRSHEVITTQFIPRADLVLFITSADRPFTESERQFLERIRAWGKKVTMVINKIDILQSEDDLRQVVKFVAENSRLLLGIDPQVFAVSARLALQAKLGETGIWEHSRFEELERYIRATLDERSKVQLKLLSPLGVGQHLCERYQGIARSRLELLGEDLVMLSNVERQLALYGEDMQRDFEFRLADIENVLYEMEQRGDLFFDETFRLLRVRDLMNKDLIRREFEQKVIADVPQRIDAKVNEVIDWLVDADLRQWQAVNEHIAERRRAHQESIVGDFGPGSFVYDRERLMEALGRQAQQVVEGYDRAAEAQSIAQGAQEAVAASAVLEVGAIGLGALVAALASTMAADVTGILVATFIAALGLVIIPARKRAAKQEMHAKIAALRSGLMQTLRTQFEKEIQRSLRNIQHAMAPYERFVRSEERHLRQVDGNLERLRQEIGRLKATIEQL